MALSFIQIRYIDYWVLITLKIFILSNFSLFCLLKFDKRNLELNSIHVCPPSKLKIKISIDKQKLCDNCYFLFVFFFIVIQIKREFESLKMLWEKLDDIK
jgi:hypothetical protein